jgi:drug/metabolite transporter (DMT)-like permease
MRGGTTPCRAWAQRAPAAFRTCCPAFGVIFSALFLGEYPLWYHFAGIVLIVAGIALSSIKASSASSTR